MAGVDPTTFPILSESVVFKTYTKSVTCGLSGTKATLIILDDYCDDMITKPTQQIDAQKEALSLFAAGYRPLKNQPMPKIGMIDIVKIRKVKGKINPVILQQAAGIPWYSKNKKDVASVIYHALYRLSKSANIETYRILLEQHENIG